MPLHIEPMTRLALAVLVSVLLGIGVLIGVAILRRWQQERFLERARSLRQQCWPILVRLLGGGHSTEDVAALRALPLAEREMLCEPLLSRGHSPPIQLATLQELCTELGLLEAWQRRLIGQSETISFYDTLTRPEGLLHRVRSLNFVLRAHSARNLGILRHQPSWPLLVKALDDPHPDVQSVALRSLAAIREPRSFPALVERLHGAILGHLPHLSPGSLKAALGSFPLSDAVKLMPSLRHPHPQIRVQAIDILREMVYYAAAADKEFVLETPHISQELTNLLLTGLNCDEDPEVRGRAAEVIAHLDSAFSTPVLCELLHDPKWFVRLRTVRALAKPRYLTALAEIRQCLTDPHWRVCEAAVQTLLALRLEGASQLLEHFLRTRDRASRELIIKEIERLGFVSALLERYGDGRDSLENRVIDELVNMHATNYLFAVLKGNRRIRIRGMSHRESGLPADSQKQARSRLLASLEADRASRVLARAHSKLAA